MPQIFYSIDDKQLLAVIRGFISVRQYSPTVRELAEAMDSSVATTHLALVRLRTDNQIAWDTKRPRTIRVVEKEE